MRVDRADELQALRQEVARLRLHLEVVERRLAALDTPPAIEPAPSARKEEIVPPAALPQESPPQRRVEPPPLPAIVPAARPEAAAPPPMPAVPPAPPRETILQMAWRAFGPEPGMSWEMALGTYWLPRVAVLLLSIGTVWGLTLAVQKWGQEWLPYLRIAVGYAIALGLMGTGKFIEGRRRESQAASAYLDYSRLTMGAGMALLYFVTFAMHYVPYTRIIARPEPVLLLLSLIMAAWGIAAHWRASRVLALSVVILGHFTLALSSLTLERPPMAGVAALTVLAAGGAFLLWRHRWYEVGLAAVIGSHGNYFLWLFQSEPSGTVGAFIGSMGILFLNWAIFAAGEFATVPAQHTPLERRMRNGMVTLNSAAALVIGVGLVEGFDFSRDYTWLFLFAFAGLLLAFGLAYRSARLAESLYNAYLTKAATVAALGFVDYFEGPAEGAALALEAIALLHSARRNAFLSPRLLAIALAFVAFGRAAVLLAQQAPVAYGQSGWGALLAWGVVTAGAFLYLALLYERTRWSRIPAHQVPPFLRSAAILMDVAEPAPAEPPFVSAPAVALPLAHLFALMASMLGLLALNALFPQRDGAPAAALFILLLVTLSYAMGSRSVGMASLVPLPLVGVWWLQASDLRATPGLPFSAMVALPLLGASEVARRSGPRSFGDLPQRLQRLLPYVLSCMGAVVWVMGTEKSLRLYYQPLALFGAALSLSIVALVLGAAPIGLAAFLPYAVGAFAITSTVDAWERYPLLAVLHLALAAATALHAETRWLGERPGLRYHQRKAGPYILYVLLTLPALAILGSVLPNDISAFTLLAILAGALSLVLHARALAVASTLSLCFGLAFYIVGHTEQSEHLGSAIYLWLACGAGLALGRFFTLRRVMPLDAVEHVLVVAVWLAICDYLQHVAPADLAPARLLGLSIFLLLYGGLLRVPMALIVSVAGAVIATITLVQQSYNGLPLHGAAWGYVLALAFWLMLERGEAMAEGRFPAIPVEATRIVRPLLVAVPALLLVLFLERIPTLSSFYLTIAWTLAALGLMGYALLTRERYFRYAALAIFLLALGRVLLVDTRRLETLYRVAAVMFLGAVLLGVGYGYIKARERGRE